MARQKYQTKRRCVYILLQVSPMGYPVNSTVLCHPKKSREQSGYTKKTATWFILTEHGIKNTLLNLDWKPWCTSFVKKKEDTQHMVMEGMQDMLLYMNVVVLQTHLRLSVTT